MSNVHLNLADVERIAHAALRAAGAGEIAARSVARSTMAAERDGISSHGLAYIPIYCEHLRCGKLDRGAVPTVSVAGAVVKVDARSGFAHPAIDLGFSRLVPLARELGVAALAIRNSYNCGVLGHHTQVLAMQGLLGLGFTNSPASIAQAGGRVPVIGTNPWSLAAPAAEGGVALLIDQSASVIARSEVMKRARLGERLPEGWALDRDGAPTTDPAAALAGSMAPAGGYKGVGSGLLVEVLAACLTGATLGADASPFSGPRGGPPNTGQFFLAVDPRATGGDGYANNIARLVDILRSDPGAHVPGDRRKRHAQENETAGVSITRELHETLTGLAG